MAKVNISQAEEIALLDKLSAEKAIELLPVRIYVLIMMVTGLCGNVMVCVFYNQRKRVTPTTRLIVALAVIDTIACILMPTHFVDISFSYKFVSSALCQSMVYVNHAMAIAAILVLIAVTSFRFRAVCKPFSSQFSLRHANMAALIAVGVSLVTSVSGVLTHESIAINITVDSHRTITGYDCNASKKPSLKVTNLCVNVLYFLILVTSTSVFVVLYGKMGLVIFAYYKRKRYLSTTRALPPSGVSSKSEVEVESGCTTEESDPHTNKIVTISGDVHPDMFESVRSSEKLVGLKGAYFSDQQEDAKGKPQRIIALAYIAHAGNQNDTIDDVNMHNGKQRDAKHAIGIFDKNVNDTKDLKKRKQSDANTSEEHRLFEVAAKQTAMLFMITAIFLLGHMPYLAMHFSRSLSKVPDSDADFTNWIQFCTRSYLINSAANPFVYGLFNSEFRAFVKKTVCRCCSK